MEVLYTIALLLLPLAIWYDKRRKYKNCVEKFRVMCESSKLITIQGKVAKSNNNDMVFLYHNAQTIIQMAYEYGFTPISQTTLTIVLEKKPQ